MRTFGRIPAGWLDILANALNARHDPGLLKLGIVFHRAVARERIVEVARTLLRHLWRRAIKGSELTSTTYSANTHV